MNSLYETFIIAFSANNVRFKPTFEEFEHRMNHKLLLDYSISAGAFDGERLVGFILHTKNEINRKIIAYNGGTGVLPEYRNQQIGERIYGFLIPKITEQKIEKIYLEVVSENPPAIRLYEKIGFELSKETKCYKQVNPLETEDSYEIQKIAARDLKVNFNDFEPSFIDQIHHLKRANETALVAYADNEIIGYLIFQEKMSRISQLAVKKEFRRKMVGSQLIQSAKNYTKKPLTMMNIPASETEMNQFLISRGFENQVNQFEMVLVF